MGARAGGKPRAAAVAFDTMCCSDSIASPSGLAAPGRPSRHHVFRASSASKRGTWRTVQGVAAGVWPKVGQQEQRHQQAGRQAGGAICTAGGYYALQLKSVPSPLRRGPCGRCSCLPHSPLCAQQQASKAWGVGPNPSTQVDRNTCHKPAAAWQGHKGMEPSMHAN